MLRGLHDIILPAVTPLIQIKDVVVPYLGSIANTIKDALPKLKDPENSYWLYPGELPSLKGVVVLSADAISTIHPNYLLVAATFIAAFFVLYIKMKYPFWNQIPALHVYDWHRRFLYSEKPYIVHGIPKKTKYYEPRLVKTERFQDLEESRKTELATLLQNHYLPSDRVFCSVKVPDLAAQCANALISTWIPFSTPDGRQSGNSPTRIEDDIVLLNTNREEGDIKGSTISVKSKIREVQGFITSRKINTAITLGSSDDRYIVQEPANYIDYLCFDKTRTFTSNIRKLFHTHEYNERMSFPERNITLFKKEVELCDAIVPLVEYEAFTFYMRHRIEPTQLPRNFQLVRIQRENLRHLHDWMERVASLQAGAGAGFTVSVTAEIGDLIHLLQTNQMFAYVLRGPDPEVKTKLDMVYAIYFFRNAHMKYEDLEGGDTLHANCSFCNTNDADLYFLGFVCAVREARKDLSGTETKMLMVDDLGHLRGVAKRWQQTHDTILRTKCAYYFCNYVVPRSPYLAETVNVLL
jgi:hypothetical protein